MTTDALWDIIDKNKVDQKHSEDSRFVAKFIKIPHKLLADCVHFIENKLIFNIRLDIRTRQILIESVGPPHYWPSITEPALPLLWVARFWSAFHFSWYNSLLWFTLTHIIHHFLPPFSTCRHWFWLYLLLLSSPLLSSLICFTLNFHFTY